MDIKIDTPMMCCTYIEDNNWVLRYYAGNGRVFALGDKSPRGRILTNQHWNFMIPFSRFDANDPRKSLPYNLVK